MRTIKFRGKEVNSDQWVHGFYTQGSFIDPVNNTGTIRHLIDSDMLYDVDSATVGQFTGLLDKDGKEIYEGDILAVEGIPFGVVRWHEDGYFFIDDSTGGVVPNDTYRALGEMIRFFNRTDKTYSVIGNIHDNPELLRGCRQ